MIRVSEKQITEIRSAMIDDRIEAYCVFLRKHLPWLREVPALVLRTRVIDSIALAGRRGIADETGVLELVTLLEGVHVLPPRYEVYARKLLESPQSKATDLQRVAEIIYTTLAGAQ